jgi:hypothetical protein
MPRKFITSRIEPSPSSGGAACVIEEGTLPDLGLGVVHDRKIAAPDAALGKGRRHF